MDRHYIDLRMSVLHTVPGNSNTFLPDICSGVSYYLSNGLLVSQPVSSFSMTWAVAGKVGGECLDLKATI